MKNRFKVITLHILTAAIIAGAILVHAQISGNRGAGRHTADYGAEATL